MFFGDSASRFEQGPSAESMTLSLFSALADWDFQPSVGQSLRLSRGLRRRYQPGQARLHRGVRRHCHRCDRERSGRADSRSNRRKRSGCLDRTGWLCRYHGAGSPMPRGFRPCCARRPDRGVMSVFRILRSSTRKPRLSGFPIISRRNCPC